VALKLNNTGDVDPKDEIKLMQRGRMMCGMQAWWSIWGFQSYPPSTPSAKLIKVRLPAVVADMAADGKVCDMSIYFARPTALCELTYSAFFSKWDYGKKLPKRVSNDASCTRYSVTVSGKPYFIYPYYGSHHIVRIGMVPMNAGEIFWLRLLLYKLPAVSFLDVRTVLGQVCQSFQAAAQLRRLLNDEGTATDMFNECIFDSTPHELRVLFTNMTLEGFPTLHIYNSADVKCMYADFVARGQSQSLAVNYMLVALAKLFKLHSNKLLVDYGLPEPMEQETELQIERITYGCVAQTALAHELLAANPLTDEMQQLCDDIEQVGVVLYVFCDIYYTLWQHTCNVILLIIIYKYNCPVV
jgi:hypothetical protein